MPAGPAESGESKLNIDISLSLLKETSSLASRRKDAKTPEVPRTSLEGDWSGPYQGNAIP